MAIGKVSFGQASVPPQANAEKSPSLLKDTVIAGGVGAATFGVFNYIGQRNIIKNADTIVKAFRENGVAQIKNIRQQMGNTPEAKEAVCTVGRATFGAIKYVRNLAKNGINGKQLASAAAVGAVLVGGIYLVYRGIKALFTK